MPWQVSHFAIPCPNCETENVYVHTRRITGADIVDGEAVTVPKLQIKVACNGCGNCSYFSTGLDENENAGEYQ